MQLVQGDEVPLVRILEHRGGSAYASCLVAGAPGSVDNFALLYGSSEGGDFFSPRHRHNFEQIRVQLEGAADFDRDGTMAAGTVGYFPEGVFYGPQVQRPDVKVRGIVLQFGGASGCGYLSDAETRKATKELKELGEFKNGVFRAKETLFGKKNVDGNRAIWEHHHNRPIIFPKPRYAKVVMMDSNAYAWVPVQGAPGVSEKLLGVFTERRTTASRLKIDAGASHTLDGRSIYFVVSGKGVMADGPARAITTLFLDHEEVAKVSAQEEMDILRFGLPDLRGVTMTTEHDENPADEVPAEAAE